MNKYLLVSLGLVLALAGWAGIESLALTIPKAAQPPVIDGDLSDPIWQTAARLDNFVLFNTNQPAAMPTTGLICYDRNALYVAFRCAETNTAQLIANVKDKDGPVSRDDCVELFVKPPNPGREYYHFLVNSLNTRQDQRNWQGPGLTFGQDNAWDGDWQSAVKVTTNRPWTVELAIPWYNFAEDLGAGYWSLNLCRQKRTAPMELSSAAYANGSFHDQRNFIRVNDLDLDVRPWIGLQMFGVAVAGYQVNEQGQYYEVTGTLVNKSPDARPIIMEVWDRPDGGAAVRTAEKLTLAPNTSTPFRVRILMPAPGPRSFKIRLLDPATEAPLYVTAFDRNLFPRLLTAYFDRNYYTTEKKALAIFKLETPNLDLPLKARAEIDIGNGDVLKAESRIRDPNRTVLKFAVRDLPLGTHPATLTVTDTDGQLVASVPWMVRRELPIPPPAHEVKVDHDRMILLLDGEPYFPIVTYGVPPEQMPTVASAGFNTLVRWDMHGGSYAALTNADAKQKLIDGTLDAAQQAGLRVIDWPQGFLNGQADYDTWTNQAWTAFLTNTLPFVVETAARHPALVAYYGPDEPYPNELTRAAMRDYVQRVRRIDPYHPNIFLFCLRDIPGVPDWPDVFDAAGHDCYCVGTDVPIMTIYNHARRNSLVAHGSRTPYLHVPLVEYFSGSRHYLRGDQQTAQGYLSLIADANGMMWWVWPARYRENWEALKKVVDEIRQLTPVLVEATPDQAVVYRERGLTGTVKVLIKNHAGRTFLIACNASPDPLTATFQLAGKYKGRARVWFEDRELPVTDARLADEFAGYARHVYELKGEWPSKGALELVIKMEAPAAGAGDQRISNLLTNADFETTGGWRFLNSHPNSQAVTGNYAAAIWHGGKQSLMIHREQGAGVAQYWGPSLVLDPNTRYVFGGYAMVEGQSQVLMGIHTTNHHDDVGYTAYASQVRVLANAGWGKYEKEFVSYSNAVTVAPVCQLREGAGTAWFDDLYLSKVGAVVAEPARKNLVRNSGFEHDNVPGWPARWMPFFETRSGIIGDPDGIWAVDLQEKYEGRRSLRLTNPPDWNKGVSAGQGFNARDGLPLAVGGVYTLSAFVKAGRTDLPVLLQWGYNRAFKEVKTTTAWQRYSVIYTNQNKQPFINIVLKVPGTVWVDAVQLEQGAAATEYEAGPESVSSKQ